MECGGGNLMENGKYLRGMPCNNWFRKKMKNLSVSDISIFHMMVSLLKKENTIDKKPIQQAKGGNMLRKKDSNVGETMKKKVLFQAILIIAISFIIVACSGNDTTKLVGTWKQLSGEWELNAIVLNKDGTGMVENDQITWRVENNRMYFQERGEDEYGLAYTLYKSGNELNTSIYGQRLMGVFKKQNSGQVLALYLDAEALEAQERLQANNQARNAIVSDLMQFGVQSQSWYRFPTIMGGPGAAGLTATTLPQLTASINYDWTGAGPFRNPVGTYAFTVNGPTEVTILGTSIHNNSIRVQAVVNLIGGTADQNYGIAITELDR